MGLKLVSIIRNRGVSAVLNVLKSMEIWSGRSEMSVISQVSTVEGCPLSRVPLYSFVYTAYMARVISHEIKCGEYFQNKILA